jgi:hypothetical protein
VLEEFNYCIRNGATFANVSMKATKICKKATNMHRMDITDPEEEGGET